MWSGIFLLPARRPSGLCDLYPPAAPKVVAFSCSVLQVACLGYRHLKMFFQEVRYPFPLLAESLRGEHVAI